MTIVRASFVDGVRVPLGSGTITYTPTRPLPSTEDASKTVMPVHAQASVTAGVVQDKDLNPGPYEVRISIETEWFLETYQIIVPEAGPVNLMDLVEETTEYQPPVVGAVSALRDEVIAAAAAVEGLSTAQDAAVADLLAPGTETRTVLDGTYAPVVADAVLTRDGAGRISSAIENGVTVTYTRDPQGRIASETRNGKTTTYTRDGAGRVSGWATV